MPKGASVVLAAVFVLGGILAARQFQQSAGPAADRGVITTRERFYTDAQPPAVESDGISVYFSPRGGCEAAIVAQIGAARRTIDVQAYTFTSVPISEALADAEARGVRVRAVLDQTATSEHDTQAIYLQQHGVATFTDGYHPIAHNKVIILDEETVITGSFNYTHQAENANAENLLIIAGKPEIAAAYEKNFEHHLSHSHELTVAVESDHGRWR